MLLGVSEKVSWICDSDGVSTKVISADDLSWVRNKLGSWGSA